MKKTYLILAVLAVVIFYLFKSKSTAAANPLAFPSQLPLPPASNLGASLSTLPSQTPTFVPQGPTLNGSWIGGPTSPDAVVTLGYQATDPAIGTNAPAAAVAPDFSVGAGFFSTGTDTSSVFLA